MKDDSKASIAARIRGLIGGQDSSISDAAKRLKVDEVSLRMSVDTLAPYPTVDVIAAVVREYGVDPTWLLTGDYDATTHRTIADKHTGELPIAIHHLIDRITPHRGSELIRRDSLQN
jgi:hypothetical protein